MVDVNVMQQKTSMYDFLSKGRMDYVVTNESLPMYKTYGYLHNETHTVEQCTMVHGHYEYIRKDIINIKQSYIRLGFHLDEFRRFKYYTYYGYDNFYDFCLDNFGMEKSAVSRCINVFKKFSMVDDSNNHKMFLDEKYAGYSYSQLCEMLPLDDKQILSVKPDMTVKEIREIKNRKKSPVATSQPGKKEKQFDIKKYLGLSGAAKKKYVSSHAKKNVMYAKMDIYDREGNLIATGQAQLLSGSGNQPIVAVCTDFEKKGGE